MAIRSHAGSHSRIMALFPSEECYAGRVNWRHLILLFPRIAILILISTLCQPLPASAANWTVRAQPTRLVNGGPLLFQIKPPVRLESLAGTWLGHNVPFSFDAKSNMWYALAGVSLETSPGIYSLELNGETAVEKSASNKISFSRKLEVVRGKYPKIQGKLSVAGKFTEPDTEQQKQIEERQEVKRDYLIR